MFGGSVLSVVTFFAMTSRRSRQLSRNADDLHGSARWANEIGCRSAQACSVPSAASMSAAGVRKGRAGFSTSGTTVRNMYSHSRRRGPVKASASSYPTLLAWEESTVVYDIKGENWAKTAGFRARAGSLFQVFTSRGVE